MIILVTQGSKKEESHQMQLAGWVIIEITVFTAQEITYTPSIRVLEDGICKMNIITRKILTSLFFVECLNPRTTPTTTRSRRLTGTESRSQDPTSTHLWRVWTPSSEETTDTHFMVLPRLWLPRRLLPPRLK